MEKMKTEGLEVLLKTRFDKLYPGKRLLAIHLNGFSHSLFFDNGSADNEILIDRYSACMPEGSWSYEATILFAGVGHINYQNAPLEIVFVERDKR
jgi:uncharacterized protein (UPF0276 family)